jgi:hypothetical protein
VDHHQLSRPIQEVDTLALLNVEQFHKLLKDIKEAIDNFFAKTNRGIGRRDTVEEFETYEGLLKSFRKILEGAQVLGSPQRR